MNDESKEIISIMKEMFGELSNRMDKLEKGQTEIKMTLENVTNKNINALVDGHMQNASKLEKLDTISNDVEYIKLNMNVVEAVTKVHTFDIDLLKKAK